jgi:alkanesulfonate monooxygenase SsuD/methylene tetrahydromethanopterin reductase-like flavin-dependent oxidoreductase (luciferase family)
MEFERPGPRLRDYVRAVKACFTAFRTGKLDHRGEFYELDFISPQWSAGPIDAADPKVDVAAVNPWMLRMAGEVADGVHVHPLGEPGYLARHVVPNVAEGAAKSGRSASDIALIVPVMTIVGDSDEERHKERELARVSMSFYGSTPNYAFIWDEAGFEGTTADHRRPHRDVRDRVDVGRLGRRADRQARRNRNAHRAVQRARRSGARRAIRRRRAMHLDP